MVTEEKLEVVVTRLKLRLVRVLHPGGYQLVAGGRLIVEDKAGVKTAHPDMPEYTPDMFPVDFSKWSDDNDWEESPVKVEIVESNGRPRRAPLSCVRASTLLFAHMPSEQVKAWLRSKAGGAG